MEIFSLQASALSVDGKTILRTSASLKMPAGAFKRNEPLLSIAPFSEFKLQFKVAFLRSVAELFEILILLFSSLPAKKV